MAVVVIDRIKTFVNHSKAIELLVHLFSLVVNRYVRSGLRASSSSGNYCCCISLPLKITSGGRLAPMVEIYSTIVVQIRDSGCFANAVFVANKPIYKPLIPRPSIKPVLSIFHLSCGLILLISGMARRWNHSLSTLILVPFNRLIFIRFCLLVLRTGYLRINFCNQCLPTSC